MFWKAHVLAISAFVTMRVGLFCIILYVEKVPSLDKGKGYNMNVFINVWDLTTLIASDLLPACQINCGEPRETTTDADRVCTRVAHQVFVLIDCTGAQRGCIQTIFLCSARPVFIPMPFSAPRPLLPPANRLQAFSLGLKRKKVMEEAWAC